MNIYLNDMKKVKGELVVDYYTPVNLRFEENNKRPRDLLMFRIINEYFSLIEFSINSLSGKLIELTFVSMNNFSKKNICTHMTTEIKNGNPDFDCSKFKEKNIITKNTNFDVFRDGNELIILLKNNINKRIEMDCAEFWVDEQNELVGIKLKNFSKNQWKTLNEIIDSLIDTRDSFGILSM